MLNVNHGKKDSEAKLTEDTLEEVISFFENKTDELQPAAAIDNPPPPTFEMLESRYDDEISAEGRKWAKEIYGHWQTRRIQNGNRSLLPSLKFETGQETDDADAYVCFRRREVRQARKTRGRDAQVAEKLKKLRMELELARNLVMNVNQRERVKKEQIETERKIFEQRSELKRVKIQQGITGEKGDDETLLVNQRPAPKPKARESGARPTTLRINTTRSEGRAPENDLIQLSDQQEEAAANARRFVEDKIQQHRKWNNDWVDITWNPITPPPETSSMGGFLPRLEEVQLPTPPASLHSESSGDHKDVEMKDADGDADLPTPVSNGGGAREQPAPRTMFRFNSPPPDLHDQDRPQFRRRYGRGGRLFIEPRKSRQFVMEKGVIGDSDDEEDEDTVVYDFDCYDTHRLQYRATLLNTKPRVDPAAAEQAVRRTNVDVAMVNGQGTAGQQTAAKQQ